MDRKLSASIKSLIYILEKNSKNDNFHAGFCLGVLLKLPVQLCLVLASASYAYYAKTKKTNGKRTH